MLGRNVRCPPTLTPRRKTTRAIPGEREGREARYATEIDLRVGGKFPYVWRRDNDGTQMGMGGVYREIVAPEQIVNTEKFDEAWYPGEAVDTLLLVARAGRTTLAQTVLYESRAARDAVLKSGMEKGVAASYDRLAELLASTKR